MNEVAQLSVTKELTLGQLEISLIALDVFNTLIKNKTLQPLLLDSAQKSEKFFGFSPSINKKLVNSPKFNDEHIGLLCDLLFDLHERLEAENSLS